MKRSATQRRKAAAKAKARGAPSRLAAPRRELLLRLDHLRSATRELARAYLTNLEHDIIELHEAVTSPRTPDGGKATMRAISRMSDVLDDLTFKPHKGRRSDLKKVEKAIQTLQRVIAKQSGAGLGGRG